MFANENNDVGIRDDVGDASVEGNGG
jgi:hypothetical protein